MSRKIKPLLGILMAASLGLAACAPVQAKEGQIYVAGVGARVTAVIGMARLLGCDVPPNTLALAVRKTYFGRSNGSQGWDITPLTQVAITELGCSLEGGPSNFISGDPETQGWRQVKDPKELEQAETNICSGPGLRDLNPKLNEACNAWGIKK